VPNSIWRKLENVSFASRLLMLTRSSSPYLRPLNS